MSFEMTFEGANGW